MQALKLFAQRRSVLVRAGDLCATIQPRHRIGEVGHQPAAEIAEPIGRLRPALSQLLAMIFCAKRP